ncbi:BofC C-terminal domain-containing protein [Geosporobacter subterraneus DSM 17957]|uniref:BofC C-terminal domain-containing protein n=1 Tax=Geosporobacter subterraneus DSM 17957 TaxID=1121919 RepID=A0A1M6BQE2_9FIRM|nr:BofC C-terminal domain-containing protein [Geosporobacter subterraneus]SHI51040.1 BofC C-terminal domain-containing protein [Geosporobacter subterraneus DSM 17957]
MLRRRRRRRKYVLACVVLLLAGFIYGYVSNETRILNKPGKEGVDPKNLSVEVPSPQNENPQIQEPNNLPREVETPYEIEEPVVNQDNIITNNTRFLLKTYFEQTRDTITREIKIPGDMIGKSLEEFSIFLQNAYGEWDVRELNKDLVELYRIKDGISPNHYIVKQSNGYIAIFHIDEEGNPILLEQTNIPVSALTEIDREKLRRGIVVKGMDGVNQILEDYSS